MFAAQLGACPWPAGRRWLRRQSPNETFPATWKINRPRGPGSCCCSCCHVEHLLLHRNESFSLQGIITPLLQLFQLAGSSLRKRSSMSWAGFKNPFNKPGHEQQAANCDCGCVPNVLSLHEAAKERARRRVAAAALAKPSVAEYLATQKNPMLQANAGSSQPVPSVAASSSTTTEINAPAAALQTETRISSSMVVEVDVAPSWLCEPS